MARRYLEEVHIADVEAPDLSFITGSFDAVICSHVLEHLKESSVVLGRITRFLKIGGQVIVIVAVPNVLEIKNRVKLLMGKFEYEDQGIMDRTHLRFFTWHTAVKNLIDPARSCASKARLLKDRYRYGWFADTCSLYRMSHRLDELATRAFPNLFRWQIVISARRCR